jgi:hypothetical protein
LRLRLGDGFIVQVLNNHSAAAFQSASVIAYIGDEVFQRPEEKGTEPSLLAIGASVCTSLDEISEKALDEIPRVLCAVSVSA